MPESSLYTDLELLLGEFLACRYLDLRLLRSRLGFLKVAGEFIFRLLSSFMLIGFSCGATECDLVVLGSRVGLLGMYIWESLRVCRLLSDSFSFNLAERFRFFWSLRSSSSLAFS